VDLALAALGILIALTVAVRAASDARWRARTDSRYQRVFSAGAAGLLLISVGLAGGDLRISHGWFRGGHWSEPPIWWQVALGAVFLGVAAFWCRPLVGKTSR
jgi:hypothetical protein